ncbi:MAG: signal peptide peptidase SppA [Prevotella sp.]|nr:signal peptide peptidase SppA [Prevotella sp.]MDY4407823.1 signal peptide peptidase SppA [Prevotella sp.]
MKDFLKYMSATVVGIIVFSVLVTALSIMCLVGMVASESSSKNVSDNSVLVINLNGTMTERSDEDIMSLINSTEIKCLGLDDVISAIEKAKANDNIKGIYIEAGMFSADSYASLQAVRRKLLEFKKSGKWIVAYGDIYTQSTYYLSSVANKVLLNPSGQIDWRGMAAQPMFFKDVMEKFGVKMQLSKVGTYKSAPEMFTADKMSEPNREQITVYINGLWQNICQGVSESRGISIDKLNAYADGLFTFSDPKDYVSAKFVDKLTYTDGIKKEINALLKNEADEDINTITLADMATVKAPKKKGEEIAVYYAYGDIVDEAGSAISQGHNIVGKDVCKDLQDLMNDDDVKAVVLRVNSGGGSAYASEQIWHYVEMLKQKKPVVVSMGGMAASGGYYISSGANWIVAEPTTLTGSIGIFGMFPDFSGLLTQKLGVKFDEVKTNKFSAFGTMARPFNEEEMNYLNKYIERGYALFRSRVAQGRKMKVEEVETIAQGRVWLGQDAFKNKLVDELGGLDKAVAKAAQLAKLKEYHTAAYPSKSSLFEQFANKLNGDSYIDNHMRMTLGEYYEPFMMIKTINKQNAIQAKVPFVLNIK